MWAVKHCFNKILHFLTGMQLTQVVLYNGCEMVVVRYDVIYRAVSLIFSVRVPPYCELWVMCIKL